MPTQATIDLVEKTTHETYEWLADVARETGLEDRHYAFQALRGVLQAVRDEITADQSGHLSAQLPTLIRGLYFENWDPSRAPATDRSAELFIDHVRPHFIGYGERVDFPRTVAGVLRVLQTRMPDEYEKIKATISRHIRELWP